MITIEKIKELYPLHEWGGMPYISYEVLLDHMGEVVIQVDDNDYQGDSRVLFKKGDQFGYLNFGWGSCSGCDALQGCTTHEEILSLATGLEADIEWKSRADMLAYFQTNDWEGKYSWHAEEQKDFIKKVIDYLSA
jgi:hypothetical protein